MKRRLYSEIETELRETKEALRKLQRSVADAVGRAAEAERKRIEKIIKKARVGGNE